MRWKYILLGSLLLICDGCRPNNRGTQPQVGNFSPTQNGFGVAVQELGVDSGPGAALYYKGTNDKPVLVWPYIGTYGDPILYTNDVAFLLASKPDEAGVLGAGVFIAIQGTGPPMDISDDVLRIVARQSNIEFKRALRFCSPIGLARSEDSLKVSFLSIQSPTTDVRDLHGNVTWQQIFDVMADVRMTGKTNLIRKENFIYLQQSY